MFFSKPLLAAATLAASASAFTGTATLGFGGVTSCGCPAFNGPSLVAIPRALVGSHTCCNEGITLSYNGKSVSAVFSGFYDAGAGTQNVALSDFTFDVLKDSAGQTALAPVTWAFD